jgi:hypothetical protein
LYYVDVSLAAATDFDFAAFPVALPFLVVGTGTGTAATGAGVGSGTETGLLVISGFMSELLDWSYVFMTYLRAFFSSLSSHS